MKGLKYFFAAFVCFLLVLSPKAGAVTIDELADVFESIETSVGDITLEYEWYNIPPWTAEEMEEGMGTEMLIPKDGLRRYKLYLARPTPDANKSADSNDPNLSPLNWHFISEETTTLVMKDGNFWPQTTKVSYDGEIGRKLSIGGWPEPAKLASISKKKPNIVPLALSPVGFSIFRFRVSGITDYHPLSFILKKYPDMIHLDTTVREIGGFKTIHLDLLQQSLKIPVMRIYLSIDHNYTPVRFEYLRKDNPHLTFEVQSLEKIGGNLWFPSSGAIINSESDRIDAFQTTSAIICNQKRDGKAFEIDFPSGTEVTDEIKGNTYIVK